MYYYILEQQLEQKRNRFRDQLADQITDHGIAGEIVAQSSLKSIDELVEIGLAKGYTTIVAVGSDMHITRVATTIMHLPPAERPVLGTIPTDSQSLIAVLADTPNQKIALQALKARRLAYATVTEIEPNKFLLTQAHIKMKKPTSFTIDIDTTHLEVLATDIVLTGDCQLEVRNQGGASDSIVRGLAWFVGATAASPSVSLFHGERIRIACDAAVPLISGGETLATTPFAARAIRRALKIIVARATLSLETKSAQEQE